MAGGKGKRISIYKPFLNVCGKPLVSWVYDAASSITSEVYLAISNRHPLFPIFEHSVFKILNTYDNDYVEDLMLIINKLGFPLLVLPIDVAFLTTDVLRYLINSCHADICSLIYEDDFLGISYWRGNDFNNYMNVHFKGKKIYNVNTWDKYIKANHECNKQ